MPSLERSGAGAVVVVVDVEAVVLQPTARTLVSSAPTRARAADRESRMGVLIDP